MDIYDYKGPVPGDVLLLNSNAESARKNKFLQRAASGLTAEYSHAVICTGLTSCIHADGEIVDVITTHELFIDYPEAWRAIRHCDVNKIGREDQMKVIQTAQKFLGMAYVKKLRAFVSQSPLDGETFCSLLIKDVFRDLNVQILDECEKPLPVHFQHLPESSPQRWRDVTDEHQIGLQIVRDCPELKEQALKACAAVRNTREMALESKMLYQLSVELYQSILEDAKKWNLPKHENLEPQKPNPVVRYWDYDRKKEK